MGATATSDERLTLDPGVFEELRGRLRGSLLMPADAGYDESRAVWNAMIDRKPAAVAKALGIADVIACVQFARERGIPISVKGGGHNISGLAVADDALLVDMSAMRGVWVDPARGVAHAQPGCLLGDVDRETQVHGLAAPLGFISQTGIAGLTLGGGMGYLTRRFGWTSDSVSSLQVVTADGRLQRASEDEHADLFWALRGAGANFGIATDFEFRLQPIGPEMVGGVVAWPIDDAPAVLELYRDLVTRAAPEFTCVLLARPAPPAPWLPKEVHGQLIVALLACHTGPIAGAERDVQEIKSLGSPVGDTIGRRTYLSQQSLLDATQPKGRRYYWKSEYLPSVEADLLAALVDHAKRIPSPFSAAIVFPIDGALSRLPTEHSAVGNRDAAFLLNITAAWEQPADDEKNIEWARAAWRDLRRFSTGGTYMNFLTEEEGGDRIAAAYGDNLSRLAELKAEWDPDNLFRINKNIEPKAS
jgi:FAD/FMN-containing dehydrogenase